MTVTSKRADTTIVLDFETTGLSPDYGDRAIEIGAVKLVDGKVVETFQKLMYPGKRIDFFIESYTGITNSMLKKAPPCEEVMCEFSDFINGYTSSALTTARCSGVGKCWNSAGATLFIRSSVHWALKITAISS